MTEPRFKRGDRVLVIGDVPHAGIAGEISEINPDWSKPVHPGNAYVVYLDNNARSLQAEEHLRSVSWSRRVSL